MKDMDAAPLLSIGSLGGTISMQAEQPGQGVMPRLECEALLASLPQLRAIARVSTATLGLVPSASLSFQQMLSVLQWAQAQVRGGAQGVVITQGTDTLEESAYFLDLFWRGDVPLVLTGAMRSASDPCTDGPANILAAARVALAKVSRARGVLVVMNDQIHAASRVRKADSLSLGAFESPNGGPMGQLLEGQVRYWSSPVTPPILPIPARVQHRVALFESCLDADTGLLDAVIDLGYEGLVIAGFGAGHVSQTWASSLARIARQIPVVVATRTGKGATARASYGFEGGEIDLQAKGLRMAGHVCPRKCRILLWALLGSGMQGTLDDYLF